MKPRLIVTLFLFCIVSAYAQPRYDMEKMQREHLNRGVVAIRCGNKVYVSWRTLTSDNVGEKFDIYRNGKKLNKKPITKGGNFFVDEQPLASETIYEIRGGNKNGTYTLKTDAPDGYIPIKIEKPEGGTSPEGRRYNYSQ